MWGKFKLMWLVVLCLGASIANAQNNKPNDRLPKLLVNGSFFQFDSGNNYWVLKTFIINNSDDTLKYWGNDADDALSEWIRICQPNGLFSMSVNKFVHLADAGCNNSKLGQLIIPPHRSQLIPLKALVEDTTPGILALGVHFKLYRWFKSDDFVTNEKIHAPEILSDSIALKIERGNVNYDWKKEVQKYKSIPPVTDLHILTDEERKVYTLTVDQRKIKKEKKGQYRYIKEAVFLVPAIIHNNSSKELKYLSWSCSAEEYYRIDNKDFKTPDPICENNSPSIVSIPPNGTRTEIIPVISKEKKLKKLERFKVGLNINKDVPGYLTFLYLDGLKQYNIVWSNEVQINTK